MNDFGSQSAIAMRILFDWQLIDAAELSVLIVGLDIRNVRWLARHHPDNRTRENLFRLSNVEIGVKTVVNAGLFIYCYEPKVFIGNQCAIAANVSLITESNPNMSELSDIEFVSKNYISSGKIIIEDNAWIGSNAIVFPGVTIGHHAIVGAGSIVTSDVAPYAVVKGQPARLVRELPALL